jgi:hypothetical protein
MTTDPKDQTPDAKRNAWVGLAQTAVLLLIVLGFMLGTVAIFKWA